MRLPESMQSGSKQCSLPNLLWPCLHASIARAAIMLAKRTAAVSYSLLVHQKIKSVSGLSGLQRNSNISPKEDIRVIMESIGPGDGLRVGPRRERLTAGAGVGPCQCNRCAISSDEARDTHVK
jgi:hypothetical protein